MVFLIGTNHKAQYVYEIANRNRPLMELAKGFARYLEEQGKDLDITLIAEELNEEAISKNINKAKDSTARSIAGRLSINHKFCDPGTKERRTLGIPSEYEIKKQLGLGRSLNNEELKGLQAEEKKYWHKREQFWFEKIRDRLHERIMFICGSDHVKRFESLVVREGYEAKILCKNWCKLEEGD